MISTPRQAKELYDCIQRYAQNSGEPDESFEDYSFYGNVLTDNLPEAVTTHFNIPDVLAGHIDQVSDDVLVVVGEEAAHVGLEGMRFVAGVQVRRLLTKHNGKSHMSSTNFKVHEVETAAGVTHTLRYSCQDSETVPTEITQQAQEYLEMDEEDRLRICDPDVSIEMRRLQTPARPPGLAVAYGEELREIYELNRVTYQEARALIGMIGIAGAQLT
jgi:hypothetical protein